VSPGGLWDDSHRRVTFYASEDLLDWTGQSKTQVIVDALEAACDARMTRIRPSRRTPKDS
jgi:hypothetical protein